MWDERAGRYYRSPSHRGGADLELVVRFCDPHPIRSILDVGSGGGHVAARLRERGCAVVTCDVAPAMRPDVICAAEDLPFPDLSFDVVVTRLAAHHFSDLPRALKEMGRIAREAVVVEDTLWNGDELEAIYRLHDPTHVATYSEQEWTRMLATAGLEVEELAVVPKTHVFADWTRSTGCSADTSRRLTDLLGTRLIDGKWTDAKIVLRGGRLTPGSGP